MRGRPSAMKGVIRKVREVWTGTMAVRYLEGSKTRERARSLLARGKTSAASISTRFQVNGVKSVPRGSDDVC